MESKDILIELKELSSKDSIKKSELMGILKKYAHISVYDLMELSERMRKEGEYLDEEYREHFLEIYIKNFILRINELIALKDYDDSNIDKDSFDETFPILERMFEKEALPGFEGDKFPLVMLSFHYMQLISQKSQYIM